MPTEAPPPIPREFLRVMWGDWGARVSGLFSIPSTVVALYVTAEYGRIIWGTLAGIAFVVTIYRTWSVERRNRLIMQHEVSEDRLKRGPDVIVELGGLIVTLRNIGKEPAANVGVETFEDGNIELSAEPGIIPLLEQGSKAQCRVAIHQQLAENTGQTMALEYFVAREATEKSMRLSVLFEDLRGIKFRRTFDIRGDNLPTVNCYPYNLELRP